MEGNLAEQGGVVGVSLAIIILIIRTISDRDSLETMKSDFVR